MTTLTDRMDLSAALIESALERVAPHGMSSEIVRILGPVIRAKRFPAAIGDRVRIRTRSGFALAQVVGFDEKTLVLSPFESTGEVLPGATVEYVGNRSALSGCPTPGSVVDALGKPLVAGAPTVERLRHLRSSTPRTGKAPPPLSRALIDTPFETGIRAIDGFATLGRGQRMCVLAEPGVGKSTLMGMLARNSSADINVIALIGERGREVREFIEETLTPSGITNTVVVVSTSDESCLRRAAAADTAMRIAEHYRALGLHVLLQIDSLTRYLRALREIGLAAGELPVRRGYPPSVFAELPRLIERAGTDECGSITALYTVLLSSELEQDPMIDEMKSLTDGHLLLSRTLAESGHYPAVDIVASLSRLQTRVVSKECSTAAMRVRGMVAKLEKERELLAFGAKPGAEAERALKVEGVLREFLCQERDEKSSLDETVRQLLELCRSAD